MIIRVTQWKMSLRCHRHKDTIFPQLWVWSWGIGCVDELTQDQLDKNTFLMKISYNQLIQEIYCRERGDKIKWQKKGDVWHDGKDALPWRQEGFFFFFFKLRQAAAGAISC